MRRSPLIPQAKPVLRGTVMHIFLMRAQPKMFWSAASAIIACMTYFKAMRNWAEGKRVGQAMRQPMMTFDAKLSVPTVYFRTVPKPAFTFLVYMLPKQVKALLFKIFVTASPRAVNASTPALSGSIYTEYTFAVAAGDNHLAAHYLDRLSSPMAMTEAIPCPIPLIEQNRATAATCTGGGGNRNHKAKLSLLCNYNHACIIAGRGY